MERATRALLNTAVQNHEPNKRRAVLLVITTWLATALIVAQAAGLYVDAVAAGLVYLLLTLLVTTRYGTRTGVAVAASSAILVNYFFMDPLFGFAMSQPQHVVAVPVYFLAVALGSEMNRTAPGMPAHRQDSDSLQLEGLRIDTEQRVVFVDGREIRLTPTEFRLLSFLYENRGRVLPPHEILRGVWGPAYADDVGVLRTYVNQLRAKLQDSPAQPRFIRTEPGFGYAFLGDQARA